MNILVKFIFRLLPDKFVEEINAVSLDELDNQSPFIWAEDIESGAVRWSEQNKN